jgi:hypothetical protein
MKLFLTLFSFFLLSVSTAQVVDNFSDDDFTNNPSWAGDDTSFLINGNFELQSDGPQASSTLYLATPNSLIDSTEWNFLVKLGFNPSSTNYVRVYLVSDQQNLKGNLNGYFVQLGEAGTAPDSIDIFKQTGTTLEKVFTGTSGCMTSSSSNSVRLKITRNALGEWNVFADCSGGNNLSFEGQFFDNTYAVTNYFGFYCRYSTASRFDLYFFDDIIIRNILPDSVKPTVANVAVVSVTEIDVLFSEAVTANSTQNISNYSINNGIGNSLSATIDANDDKLIHLVFATNFPNGQTNILSIQNIADLAGNIMLPYNFAFTFYVPQRGDIVINEFLADPTPQVNLPNDEYVELKNNKAFPVTLNGWKFSDAATTITLPNFTIPADSYVVICKTALIDSFITRGFDDIMVVGLNSLPSLNNSNDDLTLYDNDSNVIDFVSYALSWYGDALKDDGGWSLERIDPTTPCGEGLNWRASLDANGGTPGKQNSVFGSFTDVTAPVAIALEIILPDTIKLIFSETIDSTTAVNTNNYSLSNGMGNPVEVIFLKNELRLIFTAEIDSTINYALTIQNIQDCSGNINALQTLTIEVPVAAKQFDVLITEIYADPEPSYGLPNAEYIELYNATNKTISLNGWTFSDNTSTATLPNKNLLPQSYLILCSINNIQEYSVLGDVLGVSSFPSLNNTGETLIIKDELENIIHAVTYADSWYRDNLKKEGGFSLEMIDLNSPCSGADNWKASEASNGGTPGAENSVNGINPDSDAPTLDYVLVENDTQLTLIFNEPLLQSSITSATQFTIQPNNVEVKSFSNSINLSEINITLTATLQPKIVYTITVSGISDCSGNTIQAEDIVQFGIAEYPDSGDVIINEVLFNPESFGSDFVELYNKSDKIIDLKNLLIVETDFAKRDSVLEFARITTRGFLLLPENFVALTADANYIKGSYFSPTPKNIINVSGMPNYPDQLGTVILMDTLLNKFDELAYEEKWHFALLDDKNGVSLERINYSRPTQDANNWQSAASTVGFATPAYINSQYSESDNAGNTFWLQPESFSPDNDGYNDVLNLHYQFKESGWLANINIYDSGGRLIRELVKNELLEAEGVLTWEGITDDGKKARIGIHIVWAEFFNATGEVKYYKKSCVVAGKIN